MAARKGLTGYQGIFLAITMVVMIVVILMSRDLTTSILIIGLITNFLIISSQLTLMGDRHIGDQHQTLSTPPDGPDDAAGLDSAPPSSAFASDIAASMGAFTPSREKFIATTTPAPGPAPIRIAHMPAPTDGAVPIYPGAIDDTVGEFIPDRPDGTDYDTAADVGLRDWAEGDRAQMPRGNPFTTGRIRPTIAASPCNDDEAIVAMDGDEQNAYQVRSRNDATRVQAGIFRRGALVDRYAREELEQSEQSGPWWGLAEE